VKGAPHFSARMLTSSGLGSGIVQRCRGLLRAAPFMAVALSAAVLCVGLFYVWTRMQIVQLGYEISTLETKNRELKDRKKELMVEMASLQSPKELEKKARKLGLVFPAMEKVVHVP
jgi:cell division protein FtsL